ncbi:MAG TPA: ribonuclease D, partial [Mycobacterium sp.]|nr:ribonuclease D [Mycobacterium sp.]
MAPESAEAPNETLDDAESDVTPLLHPSDGVPDLSTTVGEIKAAAELLAGGHGPFAVDA